MASLIEYLSVIKNIRQAWKIEHKFTGILFLTICAVISGCEGWDEIEDFGEAKLDFLRIYGDMTPVEYENHQLNVFNWA